MLTSSPDPRQPLTLLQQALEQLRQLAAQPGADPIYAHSAEQLAVIVSALQTHTPVANGLLPDPPSPG